MAELPHLLLPAPTLVPRHQLSGFGSPPSLPGYRRQGGRLGPRFAELERAQTRAGTAPGLAEPEELLVLETVGRVEDLVRAVRRVPGLEWLGDIDVDELVPEAGYRDEGAEPEPGRLYLVMSSQEGIRQLLRLWHVYQEGGDRAAFPYGLSRWREVLARLNDIRRWGPEDRVRETGLIDDIERRRGFGQHVVGLELELWFRDSAENRARAERAITQLVQAADGTVLRRALVVPAAYHAVLAQLDIDAAGRIADADHPLVRAPQVMFVRPVGQTAFIAAADRGEVGEVDWVDSDRRLTPRVALLDGLPLSEHVALSNRLVIDDPDDWAAAYPASRRQHGTAMASLILSGDNNPAGPLSRRPLYVRPVLKPTYMGLDTWQEQIPDDELPPDLIDRATARLYEAGPDGPVAPTVRVICHALADPARVFDSVVSSWARVIDYLSWQYRVLFIVSAGNFTGSAMVNPAIGLSDTRAIQAAFLQLAAEGGRTRRLLAPGEAVNALTIGALHSDRSDTDPPIGRLDPFVSQSLPSPISRQGRGYRRSVKPEMAIPGGRQMFVSTTTNNQTILSVDRSARPPGQRVAAPGVAAAELNRWVYTQGTSNATALAAGLAAQVLDMLDVMRDTLGLPPREYDAVLTKALLTHSCRVEGDDVFRTQFEGDAASILTRLVGYGQPSLERVLASDHDRVLLLGWNDIADGQGHRYEIPIPPGLGGIDSERVVTVTLAWLSPIGPRQTAYRRAQLWFDPHWETEADGFQGPLRLRRTNGDWLGVRRGTLQHERFRGTGVVAVDAGATARIQVNCRSETSDLADPIPYALAVTIEARAATTVTIYEDIRVRLETRVPVSVAGP